MVVQHNVTAMNANRMLGVTTGSQSKSAEKLSSGYQINRAADDAAGLSISEKMRKQIRGLDRASTNAEDGVSSVQTAEGALTEVHDMLQRMNELAVQAANGTNSTSDRESIQNEIDQLTTEIDRVAETTKFNETYLLKGGTGFRDKYMAAHDAGLKGTLADIGSTATFTVKIEDDSDVTIAGKNYHVGGSAINAIQGSITGTKDITINGTTYKGNNTSSEDGSTKVYKYGDDEFTVDQIKAMVVDGAKVAISTGDAVTAVDSTLDKNISAASAQSKMKDALIQANKIGVDTDKVGVVAVAAASASGTTTFTITKGSAQVKKDLGLQLHVGADADMTNKIAINVESMSSKNLGIQNISVVDGTGVAATYAIDAIEDAIKTVSAQRSALGAVQNRLEHTIKNVDNVVENTTAAESRIRDTDMAEEMVTYSKNNILAQAGQSMLAQANQSNQGVLSLLG
ncbi:flagellin N-terminal helical domain-containing protein [Butyrivibrio sp. WCD2001]|uniref:flagellin N-terminal helical domain-containing protein n=1 Tax=Butyrivibrio sp. WCD2001 TaxID=1280681 RepID=UPI000417EAF1|nr:flagellin [Butyrivibrio sp. WCD2001]